MKRRIEWIDEGEGGIHTAYICGRIEDSAGGVHKLNCEQFTCVDDIEGILQNWVCDREVECPDGSAEVGCGVDDSEEGGDSGAKVGG